MKTIVKHHYRKGRIYVRQHTRTLTPEQIKKRIERIRNAIKRGSRKYIENLSHAPDNNIKLNILHFASRVPKGVRIQYLGMIRPEQRVEIYQKKRKRRFTYYTPRIYLRKVYPSGRIIDAPIEIKQFEGRI